MSGFRLFVLSVAIGLWGASWLPTAGTSGAHAEAIPFQFTRALRDRGYHDTALDYLESLENRKGLSQEVKERIPFETAIVLVDLARTERTAAAKNRRLDAAQQKLSGFVKSIPDDHPLAGEAKSALADILLGKAKVFGLQANDPANQSEKLTLQEQGRGLVDEARKILITAKTQYQQTYDQFPVYIPKSEPDRLEARERALIDLMRVSLDLAKTYYEEAQTYDEGSRQWKAVLQKATDEFEQIHIRYRGVLVGLYARMWMGKSYEEMGEIGKALGFYKELLDHQGKDRDLKVLQDGVRHFRLICLNHEKRQDHVLAWQEATSWLADNRSLSRSRTGLGIRWERARALEALGLGNAPPTRVVDLVELTYQLSGIEDRIPRGAQQDFFEDALSEAQLLSRTPGIYQQPAQQMARRLEGLLNQTGGDPEDFNTADSLVQGALRRLQDIRKELPNERDPQRRKALIEERDATTARGLRMGRVALRLADSSVNPLLLQDVRNRLAYLHFLNGEYLDAAALAEFVARSAPSENSVGMESAYLAMGAWVRAFNASPRDNDFELARIISICRHLTETWPDSDRAIDARLQLGDLYRLKNQPAQAAKWYLDVPRTAPSYADAQIKAGQAYLAAYLELSLDDETPRETLKEWETKAREQLEAGIEAMTEQVTLKAPPPELLTAARLSLVQILVRNADYDRSLKLLTDGPHAIIPATEPALPTGGNFDPNAIVNRPPDGVTSKNFASLAYQMLLRCYVATQEIDKAQEVMSELELIAGGSDSEDLLLAYEELGRELQQEITRLKEQGETKRLTDLRQSFDVFLTRLYEGKDRLRYGTLVWIGQTYLNLGEGVMSPIDPTPLERSDAAPFLENAVETYRQILSRAETDPGFLPTAQVPAVQVLLVRGLRKLGEYQNAYDEILAVLQEDAFRLDVQKEAASVLQDWGLDEEAGGGPAKLKAAMGEGEKSEVVWGWGGIAAKIRQLMAASARQGGTDPEQRAKRQDNLLDATYRLYFCQYRYGLQLDRGQRASELQQAKTYLLSFANTFGAMPEAWYERFNALYHDVLNDLGETKEDLPLLTDQPDTPLVSADTIREPEAGDITTARKPSKNTSNTEEEGGLLGPLIMLLVAGAIGVGIVVMMLKSSNGGRRRSRSRSGRGSGATTSPKTAAASGAGNSPRKRSPSASKKTRPPKPGTK